MDQNILEVENLRTSFRTDAGLVRAVRGISFYVKRGESLGIVGESGCGKSVSMFSIMGLLGKEAIVEAEKIEFEGSDLAKQTKKEMRAILGNRIGMIFQDPMTSLNPLFTIEEQIGYPLRKHCGLSKKEAYQKALEILEKVGVSGAKQRLRQYPHELSGGMRQRIMIAIAMCCEPGLLIADEPTTALDVTIQAQVLELMDHLKRSFHSSVIVITHDLGVILNACSRVIVMYGGLIMEEGTTEDIFCRPGHPYTAGLLRAVPKASGDKLVPIPGSPPNLLHPPTGCPFTSRCQYAMKLCNEYAPALTQLEEEHKSACWFHNQSVRAKKGKLDF